MLKRLFDALSKRTYVSDTLIKTFGFFGLISFPLFYFINKIILEEGSGPSPLRFFGFIFSVPLLFVDYWPDSAKRYKILYWYFTIFYCLPFYGTYMFIANFGSNIWYAKAIMGLFWLLLITDWLTFVAILSVGVLTGWTTHYLINGPSHLDTPILTELVINYIWAVLMGSAFSRGKDNVTHEKLLAMKTLAGTVAHEMRTPFLGIRVNAGCIKKFLPPLIGGYNKAKDAQLEVQPLSGKELQHLVEAPDDLDKITTSASLVIDMLLISLKDKGQNGKGYDACFMKACIAEALHEYPLTEEEASLVSLKEGPDFTFYGNTLLMKHVLFNLLKNAFYYVKAAQKGDISIWTESTPKGNTLYFKDTGKGVPASVVSHIFDRFYAHTRHGTGIGLAFCKSVMDGFGGTIACESKEGEYTTFILKFPVPKAPKMNR
jgi:signal transduction histidine kinase